MHPSVSEHKLHTTIEITHQSEEMPASYITNTTGCD